jgi:hypothetical protein
MILMDKLLKIYLRIVSEKLKEVVGYKLEENQLRFRKIRGLMNTISALIRIINKEQSSKGEKVFTSSNDIG